MGFSVLGVSDLLAQEESLLPSGEAKEYSTLTRIRTIMLSPLTESSTEALLKDQGLFDIALKEYTSFKDLFVIEGAIKNIFLIAHKLNHEYATKVSYLYAEVIIKVEVAREANNGPTSSFKKYMGKDDFSLNDVANKLYQDLKKNAWLVNPDIFMVINDILANENKDSNPAFYNLSPANLEMMRLLNEVVVFVSLRPGFGKTYKNIDLNAAGILDIKDLVRTRSLAKNLKIR